MHHFSPKLDLIWGQTNHVKRIYMEKAKVGTFEYFMHDDYQVISTKRLSWRVVHQHCKYIIFCNDNDIDLNQCTLYNHNINISNITSSFDKISWTKIEKAIMFCEKLNKEMSDLMRCYPSFVLFSWNFFLTIWKELDSTGKAEKKKKILDEISQQISHCFFLCFFQFFIKNSSTVFYHFPAFYQTRPTSHRIMTLDWKIIMWSVALH